MKVFTQNPVSSFKNIEFADLYYFTFIDGTTLFLTSHDRTIRCGPPYPGTRLLSGNYQGQTFVFSTGPSIERTGLTWEAGVKPAELKVNIGSDTRYIADGGFNWQAAAVRGLLDWSQLHVWRAIGPFTINADNTITTGNVIPLFFGYMGEFKNISRSGLTFTAYDARILLNVPLPKYLFNAQCRWTLFDTGCTLNRDDFATSSTALTGSTAGVINCSLPGQLSGYFDLGYIRWTSGKNIGQRQDIAAHLAAFSSYPNIVLSDKPIGYWRMNDGSGSVIQDSSGYGNTGTLSGLVALGGPSLLTGDPSGGSAVFSPTFLDDNPNLPQNAGGTISLPIPTPLTSTNYGGAFTIEWIVNCIYQPPSGVTAPFAIYESGPGQMYSARCWDQTFDGSVTAQWLPNVSNSSLAKVPGSAVHYVMVYRGNRTIDFYINGNYIASVSGGGSDITSWGASTSEFFSSGASAIPFTLGAVFNPDQSVAEWLNGNLGEFAIYNYAFSADQAYLHALAATTAPLGNASAQLFLLENAFQPPQAGDTFIAYPGCDWTLRTCLSKFNNKANFGGFPQIPDEETSW